MNSSGAGANPAPSEPELERGGPLARRLGLVLGPLLFIACLMAPGLDPLQRRVAAVACLTATFWITLAIPVGAASLLPAALFPLLGVMPAGEVAPLYMRDLVFLFLGAFIVALGLERWDVHKRMALFLVSRVGTSKRRLVLGFMVAASFISMWINNTATTLLMLPIALAVAARIDADKRFATCLLLGTAYAASVGGMATPVGTAPNQEFLGQFNERFAIGPRISFGEWFLGCLPIVLLFIPLAWLLMTRLLLPIAHEESDKGKAREVLRAERRALGPWTTAQRRMAVVFAATAALWVTRADISFGSWSMPGWSRLFMGGAGDSAWYALHKNDISDSTVATVMALLCFLLPAGGGKGQFLMDWRTAKRVPWDVLLLLGGGFALARGFRVSGLDAVIGGAVAPLYLDTSPWLVVLVTALVVSLVTELTSNTATTAVLLPVLAEAAVQSGRNPLLAMLPATLAASAAFMLPVATPPNAVVFATGRIRPAEMARVGLLLNLLAVAVITVVLMLWTSEVWGFEAGLPDWAQP